MLLLAACGKEKIALAGWREIPMPVSADLTSVCFADDQHGVISGGTAWELGVLLSTADGGASWRLDTAFTRKMESVTFSPDGQAYAAGQDMLLYRPPGREQWLLFRTDYKWLRDVHFPSNHQGAVVGGEGYHGGLLRVFGPDYFWTPDTLHEMQGELESVWYADSSTLVAVGAGWVVRSSDAGQSWERLRLTDDFFTSVHFPDGKTGYICSSGGAILKSTDGGSTWNTLRKGGVAGQKRKPFQAIWFSTADRGWVAGDNGLLWQTSDGGQTWQNVADAPNDADFTNIFVKNGHGWITAKGGRLFEFEE